MNLTGLLDEPQTEPSQTMTHLNEGCRDLFEGLVAALPSMRNMTMIRVCLRPAGASHFGLTLRMDFGTSLRAWENITKPNFCSAALPNQGPLRPCSHSPVPVSASAVAIVQDIAMHVELIDLPGDLLSELEYTVRTYRQRELEVFNCRVTHGGWVPPWEDDIPCTKWNPETRTWNPAFQNDMDLLIFQMGKYWEWKVGVDHGWLVIGSEVVR